MTQRFEIHRGRPRGAIGSFPGTFEQQARRDGEAVALLAGERRIRRLDLERHANRLAHLLRESGVGPECRVGILLERSEHLVAALLAVLKAGGAYVPLDPALPQARLAGILRDAGASHLLTESHSHDLTAPGLRRLHVDTPDLARLPDSTPTPLHYSENLAYVIYTSGSTGKPKGVEIRRAALDNFLASMAQRPGMTSRDTVVALTTVGFDIAVFELLLPLHVGARILLLDRDVAGDPIRLATVLGASDVTFLQATPATWRLLVGVGWPGLPGLRALCGGEVLPADLAADLLARTAELWNAYGPTETTVWSSLSRVDRRGTVSLGEAIESTRIHLLGRGLTPGDAGEIWIGGEGLARGYHSRPALTAERFVPDPFGPPGSRLYRTGDRARRGAGAKLEFIGRVDDQLKLRGFRIEPAEIEAALRRHSEVDDAVVVAQARATGDVRLVAYLVGSRLSPDLFAKLRGSLAEILPGYMVPAVFSILRKLPLTPSGKVDRQNLARRPLPGLEGEPISPETEVEQAVLDAWSEVLGRTGLGIDDDFFALGGHSLLAGQVASRLRGRFAVELAPRSLFDHPTPRLLAAAILEAPPFKEPPLSPRPRDEQPLPLSFAQRRLWFLDQLAPKTTAYNLADLLHLTGELDPAALGAALDALVARHETLRTTFPAADGRPEQRITQESRFPRILVDLTALSRRLRSPTARQLALREAERPFDLARGPLARVLVLRLRRDEHWLVLALHHIIADGWSLGVFYLELDELYQACGAGLASPLPRPRLQYADFTLWQHAVFDAPRLAKEVAYWRERLAGARGVLELPSDRLRDRVRRSRRSRRTRTLDAGLRLSLDEVGRGAGTSLFMTLLALWMTLVHRFCGLSDVLVGSPVAGRHRLETEGLIGFFVNTLVLRGDLSGESSYFGLLRRVRETVLDAMSHQELPFERLVEELRPERHLDRNPIFQVMFDLQNVPDHLGLGPLQVRRSELLPGGAEFEPSLSIREEGSRLVAILEYDASLFDATTIERLLAHFDTLALHAAARPELKLSEINIFSDAESHQTLTEWNDTERFSHRLPVTFLALFEAQTRQRPEALALIDVASGKSVTYRRLDELARRVAGELRRRGVGPERRVGVLMGRSIELIAVLLGIFRAGGAYVSFDPNYPEDRLDFMIEDSGTVFLLKEADVDLFSTAGRDEESLAAHPESAAYIIYTSGSTGEPKGVVVSHGALGWYCLASGRHYGLGPGERVLQFASISFDISVGEIFPTLASGATLVLRDDEMAASIDVHQERCREHRISVLLPPTAFWHELAAALKGRDDFLAPSLRLVSFGGEPVIGDRIAAWRQRVGQRIELLNGYGPTEATVEATIFPLRGAALGAAARIGRPIDDVSLLLLDPTLRPAGVGAAGQLAIASPGLARGYHRRPAATARSFVPHPCARGPGERLYLTGDLARHLADGTVELLGRTDRQVKVRGFRVELGEVETQALRHPAVDEAAVVVRGGRLVAYLVSAAPPDTQELRAFLRRSLPGYMVPALIVVLDALPLSPGGKIDRGALPDPEPAAAGLPYVAPGSEIETQIASVWRELLPHQRIGADDDFFLLGGHSLLATQVASRLRQVLGVEVPVRLLFERTTLAELGAEILRRLDDGQVSRWSQPPLVPAPRQRGPLSFAQQRLYFLDRLEEGSSSYLMSDAFRLTGPLDTGVLLRSLHEVVRRHHVLAARYTEKDGVVCQTPAPAGRTKTTVVDLSRLPAARCETLVSALVEDEGSRPFDLARGPAIRTALLCLGEQRHLLLRTIHHIASDGWSDTLFYRELGALYRANPLPGLPLQYADFALWQRSWLVGEVLERQLAYWKEALAGAPPRLHFPSDRPRSLRRSRRGAIRRRHLGRDLREGLEALSRENKATLFMTLLAAWALLLERYTGQDDLVVGSPIANRSRPELETLIGCFVNSLALRIQVDENRSFPEHLRQVRETALGAFAHQDLPFEKLVDELGIERHPDANPLFQVMFDHQLAERSALELEGIRAEPVAATSFTVTFEPSLTVWNDGEELVAGIEHDAEVFEEATVSRMLDHLDGLLRSALYEPGRRTGDLAFATPVEQRQVLARRRRLEARDSLSETAAATDERAAATLAKIWAEVLGLPHVGDDENFFALGGDSILSLRVLARARLAGIHLRPRDLFRHQTVAALARHLAGSREDRGGRTLTPHSGEVPLTPIQQSFFGWQLPEPWHYNQSVLVVLRRRIEVRGLAAAAGRLAEHHAALRLRFELSGSAWRQILLGEAGEPPVARLDLGRLGPERLPGTLEKVKGQVQASLDLARGPTWRLLLLDGGAGTPQRLLAVVHHLVVDAVSWGVLLDDLEHLCTDTETRLPATTSFPEWARRLDQEEVGSAERELLARLSRGTPLPRDLGGANTIASEATVRTRLGTAETDLLLHRANAAYRTRPEELLLTALGRVLAAWSGGDPLVELEFHGRDALGEKVDLSRSVGWFTLTCPVTLRVRRGDPGTDVLAVKEELRQVPRQGLAYGLLRERDGEARLRRLQPQISFNYLAHADQVRLDGSGLFAAHESPGPEQSRRGARTHLLDLNGRIEGGRFELEWAYSTHVHDRSTVEALSAGFHDELCRLLDHCLSPGAGGVSPSDFPLARIDAAILGRLLRPFAHPCELEDVYPLTPLQEGMLFHSRLAPLSGVYFEQLSWILFDVDRGALRRAWQTVVDRHPVLRTSFVWDELERPLQRVHRHVVLPFEEHDVRRLGEDEQNAAVERLLEGDRRRGFELQEAPLMRLLLVRLAGGERGETCRLVWSCHHLLLDGWSTPTVFDEAAAAYETFRRGEEPRLAPPRPFRDYLVWIAEHRNAGEAEVFWRRLLAGFETPTPLPAPPAGGQQLGEDAAPGEILLALTPGLSGLLAAAGRRRALTVNTLVRGAWARVLMAISGEDDVVFGATVSGRPAELDAAEPIVGLLVNTLPVRARLLGRESAGRVLRRLQEEQAEMQRFEATPLVEIQRWSEVAAGETLFHTVLVFENFPLTESYLGTELPGLVSFSKTSYPMTLYAEPGTRLTFELSYDPLRVGAAFAKRSLRHLETVLTALAEGFERSFSELDVLSAAERHQLSNEWAMGPAAEAERSALELFEAQAQRRPDAVAFVFRPARGGTEALTYGELDRRAEEIAEQLRAAGVGPDELVGVRLERSPRLVAALLAVWKAGAAYVPLDPSYPEERLRFMAEDAGLVARVTEGGIAGSARGPARPREVTPSDLAYVLYTSGSTGKPKGVEITHRTLARFLTAMARLPGLTPDDTLLAVTTVSFDIAALELWLPWTRGARVVLADRETARDGRRLHTVLSEERASVLQGTPATWRLLLAAGWPGDKGLKALCGGEAMPRDLAAELSRRCGEAWNLYGPTEATVWSLVHRVHAVRGAVAIGRPIDTTRVYVLDRRMSPAPIGAPGEIHLGGGLARGYRRRRAATAAAFVPDPFAGVGSRLYKTGDLARFQNDATLLFLGRCDQQVKIRGFRIEPGEIEAALLAVGGIREAAVVVQDAKTNPRLVAFVLADGAPGPAGLRALLQEKLPPHMIPTAFTALAEMPRTPAGKVDRRALAERGVAALAEPTPRRGTPTEEILAGIWTQVLGCKDVGPEESFFALGGHSLHALQVASRIRADLGREIDLRLLFENPTVRSLARRLERALPLAAAPPIRTTPRHGPLPLTFAQERMWLLERLSRSSGQRYHIHTLLEIEGNLDVAALEAALRRLVERHETQRARFPSHRGEPSQVIGPVPGHVLPVVDLSGLPPGRRESAARLLARRESCRPFDLAQGPPVRTVLLRLGKRRHAWYRTVHHIVSDGFSEQIVSGELAELYRAARNRRPDPLPRLPIGYGDFARWQRRHLAGATLERELAWWRNHLSGLPPVLRFPSDRPRRSERRPRPALLARAWPEDIRQGLERLRLRSGTTFFMASLAAFAALAGRYAGSSDVVLGTPIANRHRHETEGLVGVFVNTVLLRIDLDGDPTVRELLDRVRETSLDVHAHQDLPFERLVQELAPHRHPGENPLFEVMFLEEEEDAIPRLEGLDVVSLDEDRGTALFELTLSVSRSGERARSIADYDQGLFDETTLRRILRDYETLLHAFAEAPEGRLAELDLLGAAERHQVKLERRPLPSRHRTSAPAGATEERLAALYAEVLGLPEVDAGGEFFALGGHSLLAVRLLTRIEETFGVTPALSDLFHEPTVRQLAARLEDRAKAAPSLLVELAAGGPAPLFCVHPIGGHVLGYRELVAHLPPELSVYALQSIGHEDGRPFLEDVESMARVYLAEVREASPEGPYFLGGWSMGGWIAFEMASQLRLQGGQAARVVLIDSPAPGGNGRGTPSLAAFAKELELPDGICDPAWEALPPEAGLRRLRGRAGKALGNGTDSERLENLYRLFRNNLRAMDRYVPRFYDGPITLLVSEEWTEEELLPWQAVAAEVVIWRVPGDHRSMMREPHVRVLAERLTESLARQRRQA